MDQIVIHIFDIFGQVIQFMRLQPIIIVNGHRITLMTFFFTLAILALLGNFLSKLLGTGKEQVNQDTRSASQEKKNYLKSRRG